MLQYNPAIVPKALYIHVPKIKALLLERYHAALCKEIALYVKHAPQTSLEVLYIGGAPDRYSEAQLLDMFDRLDKGFSFKKSAEVTFEINWASLCAERYSLWASVGINRLNIKFLTIQDMIHWGQISQNNFTVVEQAAKQFEAIAVDFILTKDFSDEQWKALVTHIVTLPIKHISFSINFSAQQKQRSRLIALYDWTIVYLADNGFVQYEQLNFARKNFHSRFNNVLSNRKPYKGFGLDADSFDGAVRFKNKKNMFSYFKGIERERTVTEFTEQLTPQQIQLEKLMIRLRQTDGVSIDYLKESIEANKQHLVDEQLILLENNNFIKRNRGGIALTTTGLANEHEVIAQLSCFIN